MLAAWFYFGRVVGWTEEFVRLVLFDVQFLGDRADVQIENYSDLLRNGAIERAAAM